MSQDAEHGCAEDEPNPLLGGDEPAHPFGPANRLRWVCGASLPFPAAPRDGVPLRPAAEAVRRPVAEEPDDEPAEPGGPPAAAYVPERSRVIPRPRAAPRHPQTDPTESGDREQPSGSGGAPGTGRLAQGEIASDDRQWSGCRTDRPGWAGGHRHGAVRPSGRTIRRDRPPRRWC